jgi:predicted  nucleic acid-binding Zn-ribbon protein
MARPVLFILGTHAGGMSGVAMALAEAGATLGKVVAPTLGDGDAATTSRRLTELSDEALRRIGIAWDSPATLPERVERAEGLATLMPQAVQVVAEEFDGTPAVVAEPRLCRLLPFWRAAFEQNGFAPGALILLRRPREVAAALARHAQFAPEKSLALWHHHVIEAERGSRGLPRALLTVDQWHADPAAALARIADDAHFAPASSPKARTAAQKARPRENGGRAHEGGGMQSGLDAVLDAAYVRLGALPAGTDPRREIEALGTASREAMTAAIAPWLAAELDTARKVSARLAGELAQLQAAHAALTEETAAMRARAPDAVRLAAELESLRAERTREREVLLDELTKTRGEIVRLTSAVAEAPRAAESLRTELAQAHRDLDDERTAISRLAEELDVTRREADGNAKRFDSARHHLEALAAELAQMRDSATAREHDYTVIADEVEAWRTQIGDLQLERDKLLRERDHAMREVTRLTTEVDALRHDRDNALADRASLDEALRQSGQALAVLRDELPRRSAAEAQLARERDGLAASLKSAQERVAALDAMLGDRSSYIAELVQRHNALAARLNDLDKRKLVQLATRLGGRRRARPPADE